MVEEGRREGRDGGCLCRKEQTNTLKLIVDC